MTQSEKTVVSLTLSQAKMVRWCIAVASSAMALNYENNKIGSEEATAIIANLDVLDEYIVNETEL